MKYNISDIIKAGVSEKQFLKTKSFLSLFGYSTEIEGNKIFFKKQGATISFELTAINNFNLPEEIALSKGSFIFNQKNCHYQVRNPV